MSVGNLNYALALGMAARKRSLDLGMLAGSLLAGVAILLRALLVRRAFSVALVLGGGLAGALGGWPLGSLLVNGANWNPERLMESFRSPADSWYPEWLMAGCLSPYGMGLGLLAGAGPARQRPS